MINEAAPGSSHLGSPEAENSDTLTSLNASARHLDQSRRELPATPDEQASPTPLRDFEIRNLKENLFFTDALDISWSEDLFAAIPSCPVVESEGIQSALTQIEAHFNDQKYLEILKIISYLNNRHKESLDPVVQTYLCKIRLFCILNYNHANGKFSKLTNILPIKNDEDFIKWHLVIAQAYADNSPCLPVPNKPHQLCCYRRAADAGSIPARIAILKELLFSPVKDKIPFNEREVLAHLEVLANTAGIVETKDLVGDEAIILEMASLLKNKNPVARKTLAEKLCSDARCNVSLLACWLYMKSEFGSVCPDEAQDYLKTINDKRDRRGDALEEKYLKNMSVVFSDKLKLLRGNLRTSTTFNDLVKEGFPPAFLDKVKTCAVLAEWPSLSGICLNLIHENSLLTSFHPNFSWFHYKALTEHEIPQSQWECEISHPDSEGYKISRVNLRNGNILANELRSVDMEHCDQDSRAFHMMESLDCFRKNPHDYFQCVAKGKPKPLPKQFLDDLDECKYSQDSQVLVFKHLLQTLKGVEPDESLIEKALAADRFATLYRMVTLDHCSASMDCQQVLSEFVQYLIKNFSPLDRFDLDPGLLHVYERLKAEYLLITRRLPAMYIAQAIASTKKLSSLQRGELHKITSEQLALMRHTVEATEELANYNKVTGDKIRTPLERDRRYFLKQGAHHSRLSRLKINCCHPLDMRLKHEELLILNPLLRTGVCPQETELWVSHAKDMMLCLASIPDMEAVDRLCNKTVGKVNGIRAQFGMTLANLKAILEKQKSKTTLSSDQQILQASVLKTSEDAYEYSYHHCRMPGRGEDLFVQPTIEQQLDNAKSIDEKLKCLNLCLIPPKHDPASCDPVALAVRAIPIFTQAEPRHNQKVKDLRGKLLTRLDLCRQELDQFIIGEMARIYSTVLHVCSENKSDKAVEMIKHAELQLTELTINAPLVVAKALGGEHHSNDSKFYQLLNLPSLSLGKQAGFIVKHLLSKPKTGACFIQALAKQSFANKDKKQFAHQLKDTSVPKHELLQLINDYVNALDCEKNIEKCLNNKEISECRKADLLRTALALGVTSFEKAKKLGQQLRSDDKDVVMLRIELATSTAEIEAILQQESVEDDVIESEGQWLFETVTHKKNEKKLKYRNAIFRGFDIFNVAGLRALDLGQIEYAACAFNKLYPHSDTDDLPGSLCVPYEQAMLCWLHDVDQEKGKGTIISDDTSADIPDELAKAASQGNGKALCRLMDWLMLASTKPSDEKDNTKDQQLQGKCYRYLAAPLMTSTPEHAFYHGVAVFCGVGCNKDENAGKVLVQQALQCSSPIPALRLACLIDKRCLPANIYPTANAVDLFTKKCVEITPELRQELCFSLGKKQLRRIAELLRDRAVSNLEQAPAMQTLAAQFDVMFEKWCSQSEQKKTASDETGASAMSSSDVLRLDHQDLSPEETPQKMPSPEKALLIALQNLESAPATMKNCGEVITKLSELAQSQGDRFPAFDPHDDICRRLIGIIQPETPEALALMHRLAMSLTHRPLCDNVIDRMMTVYLGDGGLQNLPKKQASIVVSQFVECLPDERLLSTSTQGRCRELAHYFEPTGIATVRRLSFLMHFCEPALFHAQIAHHLSSPDVTNLCELIHASPDKAGSAIFVHSKMSFNKKQVLLGQLPLKTLRLLPACLINAELLNYIPDEAEHQEKTLDQARIEFQAYLRDKSTLDLRGLLSLHEVVSAHGHQSMATAIGHHLEKMISVYLYNNELTKKEWLTTCTALLLYSSNHSIYRSNPELIFTGDSNACRIMDQSIGWKKFRSCITFCVLPIFSAAIRKPNRRRTVLSSGSYLQRYWL